MKASQQLTTAAWAALGLIGSWLAFPLLFPVHMEGFTASLVLLGRDMAAGDLRRFDLLYPINVEYFGLTKLGVVAALAALTGPLDLSGDWAMRLVMWLGASCLLGSCFVLTRRWARTGAAMTTCALLLMPGVLESCFFFNDNLLASGLGLLALAIVAGSARLELTAVAGAAFAAAVLCRTDVAMLAPAIMFVVLERNLGMRTAMVSLAAFGAAAALVLFGALATIHATPFDLLRAGQEAISLWGRPRQFEKHQAMLIFFIGAPALVLMALGLPGVVRRSGAARLALLLVTPILFNLVFLGQVWEVRQLLPLTPFFAVYVASGLALVGGWLQQAKTRVRGATVVLVLVALLAFPRFSIEYSDGPRTSVGRLWTPVLWRQWQRAAEADRAEVDAVAAIAARRAITVVITDSWTPDRYLDLALRDRGFSSPRRMEGPFCSRTAELFERGDARVFHIRLHVPFVPSERALRLQQLEAFGLPCLAGLGPPAAMRFVSTPELATQLFDAGAIGRPITLRQPVSGRPLHRDLRQVVALPLDPAKISDLHARYMKLKPPVAPRPTLAEAEILLRSPTTLAN